MYASENTYKSATACPTGKFSKFAGVIALEETCELTDMYTNLESDTGQ